MKHHMTIRTKLLRTMNTENRILRHADPLALIIRNRNPISILTVLALHVTLLRHSNRQTVPVLLHSVKPILNRLSLTNLCLRSKIKMLRKAQNLNNLTTSHISSNMLRLHTIVHVQVRTKRVKQDVIAVHVDIINAGGVLVSNLIIVLLINNMLIMNLLHQLSLRHSHVHRTVLGLVTIHRHSLRHLTQGNGHMVTLIRVSAVAIFEYHRHRVVQTRIDVGRLHMIQRHVNSKRILMQELPISLASSVNGYLIRLVHTNNTMVQTLHLVNRTARLNQVKKRTGQRRHHVTAPIDLNGDKTRVHPVSVATTEAVGPNEGAATVVIVVNQATPPVDTNPRKAHTRHQITI